MLEGDLYEVLDVTVRSESQLVNRHFRDLPMTGALIGAIVREGKAIFPHGEDMLLPGDRVIVFTDSKRALEVEQAVTPFDAAGHAFATMPTGGFGLRGDSLTSFGAARQWTLTVFMLLAGTNFALLYAGFVRRRPRSLLRDEEFRLYVGLAVLATS